MRLMKRTADVKWNPCGSRYIPNLKCPKISVICESAAFIRNLTLWKLWNKEPCPPGNEINNHTFNHFGVENWAYAKLTQNSVTPIRMDAWQHRWLDHLLAPLSFWWENQCLSATMLETNWVGLFASSRHLFKASSFTHTSLPSTNLTTWTEKAGWKWYLLIIYCDTQRWLKSTHINIFSTVEEVLSPGWIGHIFHQLLQFLHLLKSLQGLWCFL